jgi:hypothetical protein
MSRWKKRNWMMGGVEFRNKFVRSEQQGVTDEMHNNSLAQYKERAQMSLKSR